MPPLDEDVIELMKEVVNSFVAWDIIAFFHEHPDTWYSPDEVTKSIGGKLSEVKEILEELAHKIVLAKEERSNKTYYAYPSGRWQHSINKFVEGLDDPELRVQMLTYLFKHLRVHPIEKTS